MTSKPYSVHVNAKLCRNIWPVWRKNTKLFDILRNIRTNKLVSVFPMVIWPAFRMRQYRVNNHPYHAPQFMKDSENANRWFSFFKVLRLLHVNSPQSIEDNFLNWLQIHPSAISFNTLDAFFCCVVFFVSWNQFFIESPDFFVFHPEEALRIGLK